DPLCPATPRLRSPRVNSARWRCAITAILIGWTVLTGCGTSGGAHPHAGAVVASTDVWGSVARAVVKSHLIVRSILSGADTDPHSYQASPSDAAVIADAALVIYNGGGYDPWVEQVLAGHPGIKSVDAYSLLEPASSPTG